MSTEKLPEWPGNPGRAGITVLDYWAGTAHAALARMEALVEELRWTLDHPNAHFIYDEEDETHARALLSLCARKEAGK